MKVDMPNIENMEHIADLLKQFGLDVRMGG
jgi:hypothetical protein